jgi:hypothetical protein
MLPAGQYTPAATRRQELLRCCALVRSSSASERDPRTRTAPHPGRSTKTHTEQRVEGVARTGPALAGLERTSVAVALRQRYAPSGPRIFKEARKMRYIVLWALGVPIGALIVLKLLGIL